MCFTILCSHLGRMEAPTKSTVVLIFILLHRCKICSKKFIQLKSFQTLGPVNLLKFTFWSSLTGWFYIQGKIQISPLFLFSYKGKSVHTDIYAFKCHGYDFGFIHVLLCIWGIICAITFDLLFCFRLYLDYQLDVNDYSDFVNLKE